MSIPTVTPGPAASEIRRLRLAAGLSQQRLAEAADCSLSSVQLLDRGYNPAESAVRDRIVAALDQHLTDERPAGQTGRSNSSAGQGRHGES